MRYLMIIGAFAAFLGGVGGQTARAQSPVAIVEDISVTVSGVELLEYVNRGRAIELGATGTLVLGYLNSCVRETINGGSVTVGEDRSIVEGGKVSRERVECGGGKMQLTLDQARKSSVVVFRRPPVIRAPAFK